MRASPRRRAGAAFLLLAAALWGILAMPAAAQTTRAAAPARPARIVVVTVDGTTLDDWARPGLPAFRTLLERGAAALLSTRTTGYIEDARARRASAYLTLGAGTRAGAQARGAGIGIPDSAAVPGAAELAMQAAGRGDAAVVGTAAGGDSADTTARLSATQFRLPATLGRGSLALAPPAAGPATRDPRFPTGYRTDNRALLEDLDGGLARSGVVLVDTGDTARVDRAHPEATAERAAWMRLAMQRVDRFLARVLTRLGPSDTLIVAAATPPAHRARRGRHLSVIAALGGGFRGGLLTSGTTRRKGAVALADLAPTILALQGVSAPAEMEGRPITIEPARAPASRLRALETEFIHAHRIRRPVLRGMLWAAMAGILAGAALLARASRTGRSQTGRSQPGRSLVATFLLAVVASPLAILVEPLWPGASVTAAGAAIIATAVGLAVGARLLAGARGALEAILGATAGVILVDLLAGTPLASRSAIGFQTAGGGRFYGIDEATMGIAGAGALIAGGLALDRARHLRRTLIGVGAAYLALVIVTGAPALGSKFGAPFTLVPALGVVIARVASRRRPDFKVAAIAIAAATVLAAGLFAAADIGASAATQSHIGRAFGGKTEIVPLILRKLAATARITFSTIWLPAFLVSAGAVAALARRRPSLLARGLWGLPYSRAALWGCGAGAAAGLVANDAGIIAAAPIAMIGASSLLVLLLVPEQFRIGPRRRVPLSRSRR